jgi:acetyl esterase/lipase
MAVLGVLLALFLVSWRTWARPVRHSDPVKPRPDYVDLRYGPFERNVLDLWQARPTYASSGTTPVVVFFHGGAFRTGDKADVPYWLVSQCLAAGISVASANYRLSQTAPFPAPMLDGARAIQFIRLKSGELGIDRNKIAASGSSAGAGIALWIGFHDDLADPQSADPIARQSSRVMCLGVDGAQTSYDPRLIKALIGGRAHEHPALRAFYGITSVDELDSPRVHQLYEAASPLNYVSRDDPPAVLFYSEPKSPVPAGAKPGRGIHHPRFGEALKAKLDPLAIECVLHHASEYPMRTNRDEDMCRDMTAFFVRHFRAN